MTDPGVIIAEIANALIEVLNSMKGNSHGIYQGTQEAVLVEAQGAQIGPVGYNHLNDLQQTLNLIKNRTLALNNAIGRLNGVDSALAARVRSALEPVFRQSSQYVQTMEQTEAMAADLARNNGTRLSGVTFGQGGMGPEVGRTTQALCSTQMQQRAAELGARGITEPSKIIPSIRAGAAQLMNAIRQLPLDKNESMQKLAGVLASVRLALTNMARQALAAGRAALLSALNTILSALGNLGGRSNSPAPLIRKDQLDELRRHLLGILGEDDTA